MNDEPSRHIHPEPVEDRRGGFRTGRRGLLWRSALLGVIWVSGALAQAVESAAPSSEDAAIASGRQRFEKNCAICHGLDARGNGPFAELLNARPPDLTSLARAEGGDFPFSRAYRRIDGRDQPLAHGTRAMPIWGALLKREGGEETFVHGRLFEILLFLESIQQP